MFAFAQGAQYVYEPTAASFKFYAFQQNGQLHPDQAKDAKWTVNWIAMPVQDPQAGIQVSQNEMAQVALWRFFLLRVIGFAKRAVAG
jgi:hypothetical protein